MGKTLLMRYIRQWSRCLHEHQPPPPPPTPSHTHTPRNYHHFHYKKTPTFNESFSNELSTDPLKFPGGSPWEDLSPNPWAPLPLWNARRPRPSTPISPMLLIIYTWGNGIMAFRGTVLLINNLCLRKFYPDSAAVFPTSFEEGAFNFSWLHVLVHLDGTNSLACAFNKKWCSIPEVVL